ncbi:Transcriptional regulator, Crp-type [Desulfonema magnum]|uniref:Transcriptional regulator, Crp-type n=2 Tax=Desulfonema magnum TaxID=45655 RepID=A0A975BHK6_9BACT|nr:Transcriptional regulator, Crp-type [Desulfonema magnum]
MKTDGNQVKNNRLKQYEILKNIPLFSCLNDEEIRALAEIAVERTFSKNTILINEGDTSDALYVVCKGKANAIGIDPNGKQIVLNTFGSGDYFGEMSFIDGEPRCATVETKRLAHLLIIPRDKFNHIITSNPEISFKLMKGLLEKIRKATRQIEDLVFMDVYGRVARLLIQFSEPRDQKRITKEKLTHQEIADMVGASREMVSRILKELSVGDYITIKDRIITINRELPYSW